MPFLATRSVSIRLIAGSTPKIAFRFSGLTMNDATVVIGLTTASAWVALNGDTNNRSSRELFISLSKPPRLTRLHVPALTEKLPSLVLVAESSPESSAKLPLESQNTVAPII